MRYLPILGILLAHVAASTSNAAPPKHPTAKQCPLVIRNVPATFRGAQTSGKKKAGVLLSHAVWEPTGEWVIVDVYSWEPLPEPKTSSSPPFGVAQPDGPTHFFPIALIAVHMPTQTTASLKMKDLKGPSSLIAGVFFPAFHPMGRDCVAVRVRTKRKSGKFDTVFWKWDLRRRTLSLLGRPRSELISLATALEKTDYELEWPREKVRGALKSVTLRQRTKPDRKTTLRLPVPSAKPELGEDDLWRLQYSYYFLPGPRRNSIVIFDNCQSRVTLNLIETPVRELWSNRFSDIKKRRKSKSLSVFPITGFVGPAERVPILIGADNAAGAELSMLHAGKGTLEEGPTIDGYRPDFDGRKSRSTADGKRVALKRASYQRFRLQRTDTWKKRSLPFAENNELVGIRSNGDLIRSTETSIRLYSDDGKRLKTLLFELK